MDYEKAWNELIESAQNEPELLKRIQIIGSHHLTLFELTHHKINFPYPHWVENGWESNPK